MPLDPEYMRRKEQELLKPDMAFDPADPEFKDFYLRPPGHTPDPHKRNEPKPLPPYRIFRQPLTPYERLLKGYRDADMRKTT